MRGNREALEKEIESTRARLAEQHQRFEAVRQKAELVSETADPGFGDAPGGCEFSISDDDVEVAFLKEKQRRSAS